MASRKLLPPQVSSSYPPFAIEDPYPEAYPADYSWRFRALGVADASSRLVQPSVGAELAPGCEHWAESGVAVSRLAIVPSHWVGASRRQGPQAHTSHLFRQICLEGFQSHREERVEQVAPETGHDRSWTSYLLEAAPRLE